MEHGEAADIVKREERAEQVDNTEGDSDADNNTVQETAGSIAEVMLQAD